jgi:hypothetical protein
MIPNTLFVPGMKNNLITNSRLEKFFFHGKYKFNFIFNYKSESIISDYSRVIIDNVPSLITTDAVARLVTIMNRKKFTHIHAHSHGTLILLNALSKVSKITIAKIKFIYGYGGRVIIPNIFSIHQKHNIQVLNFYNENDNIFKILLDFYILDSCLRTIRRNEVIHFTNYSVIVRDNIDDYKSYDFTINNTDPDFFIKKRLFLASTPKDAHKLPMYMKTIRKNIRHFKKSTKKINKKTMKNIIKS